MTADVADLLLVGGTVVTAGARSRADVAVRNGRVEAIGDLRGRAAIETIDITGKYLIPGLVDPEAHPGVHRSLAEDLFSETQAAAAAGVTTWGIQLTTAAISETYKAEKTEADLRLVSEVMPTFTAIGDRSTYIDYFITPSLNRDAQVREIPRIAEEWGVTSFKFHLHTRGGHGTFNVWEAQRKGGHLGFDDGVVFQAMEAVAAIGAPGIVSIHPENWEIVRVFQERLQQAGRKDVAAWSERSPHFTEAGHVRTYAYYARVAGCPLYIQHLTTPESVHEIELSRAEGGRVFGQCAAHYLTLPAGRYKINVPLRSPETLEAMWQAVADRRVDCVGSDHVAHTAARSQLETGDVWKDVSGFASRVEAELPIMLSEGVNRGRISLERVVELCSEKPAQVFGLYPRKGSIRVGADADLVVVDLERKHTISADMILSSAGWSAWEGIEVTGWPVLTVLRGQVVARRPVDRARAEIVGSPRGRYLRRRTGTGGLLPIEEEESAGRQEAIIAS